MLYLYHSTTSVCAIKVRLTLDEKGLAYDGKLLNLRVGEQHAPDYVKLNPNHVVPTLIHDGKVIIEFTLIIEYLDEMFPASPLMPADPYARAIARLWMKRIDDYLYAAEALVVSILSALVIPRCAIAHLRMRQPNSGLPVSLPATRFARIDDGAHQETSPNRSIVRV